MATPRPEPTSDYTQCSPLQYDPALEPVDYSANDAPMDAGIKVHDVLGDESQEENIFPPEEESVSPPVNVIRDEPQEENVFPPEEESVSPPVKIAPKMNKIKLTQGPSPPLEISKSPVDVPVDVAPLEMSKSPAEIPVDVASDSHAGMNGHCASATTSDDFGHDRIENKATASEELGNGPVESKATTSDDFANGHAESKASFEAEPQASVEAEPSKTVSYLFELKLPHYDREMEMVRSELLTRIGATLSAAFGAPSSKAPAVGDTTSEKEMRNKLDMPRQQLVESQRRREQEFRSKKEVDNRIRKQIFDEQEFLSDGEPPEPSVWRGNIISTLCSSGSKMPASHPSVPHILQRHPDDRPPPRRGRERGMDNGHGGKGVEYDHSGKGARDRNRDARRERSPGRDRGRDIGKGFKDRGYDSHSDMDRSVKDRNVGKGPTKSRLWTCSACSLENPEPLDRCEVCEAPRVREPPKATSNGAAGDKDAWMCPRCDFKNSALLPYCEICSKARPGAPHQANGNPAEHPIRTENGYHERDRREYFSDQEHSRRDDSWYNDRGRNRSDGDRGRRDWNSQDFDDKPRNKENEGRYALDFERNRDVHQALDNWKIDNNAKRMFFRLDPSLQRTVLQEFRPRGGLSNLSGKFVAFINSLKKSKGLDSRFDKFDDIPEDVPASNDESFRDWKKTTGDPLWKYEQPNGQRWLDEPSEEDEEDDAPIQEEPKKKFQWVTQSEDDDDQAIWPSASFVLQNAEPQKKRTKLKMPKRSKSAPPKQKLSAAKDDSSSSDEDSDEEPVKDNAAPSSAKRAFSVEPANARKSDNDADSEGDSDDDLPGLDPLEEDSAAEGDSYDKLIESLREKLRSERGDGYVNRLTDSQIVEKAEQLRSGLEENPKENAVKARMNERAQKELILELLEAQRNAGKKIGKRHGRASSTKAKKTDLRLDRDRLKDQLKAAYKKEQDQTVRYYNSVPIKVNKGEKNVSEKKIDDTITRDERIPIEKKTKQERRDERRVM
eukprot:gnl/MRDRNA2_/MRDRNA2_56082_c0_seq2.p1 gnl/MRDRNA2_/MRDRNA2_56082_c0~~gnl/MRDRNA2_/MRDRNA2_56082_c0_seq2.p1  ORF type:complete len:1068 (+),score=252.53 gnl/MRDRNA2_/MRDRNA2_56082_c0_seq2:184-3204(+)